MNEIDIMIESLISKGVITKEDFDKKIKEYANDETSNSSKIKRAVAENIILNDSVSELTTIISSQNETIENQERALSEVSTIISYLLEGSL